MKRLVFLFSLLIFLSHAFLLRPKSAFADYITLNAIKDTYVSESTPITSRCLSRYLTVGTGPWAFAFIQFEPVNLPENVVLDEAAFQFYVVEHGYRDHAYIRVGPNETVGWMWDECDPQWEGPYPGMYMYTGSFVDVNLDLSDGWKEIQITNIVQLWLDGELEDQGIYLYSEESEDDYYVLICSREHESAPHLEIEYHIEEASTGGDSGSAGDTGVTDGSTGVGMDTHEDESVGTVEESGSEDESDRQDKEKEDDDKSIDVVIVVALLIMLLLVLTVVVLVVILLYRVWRRKKDEAQKDKTKGEERSGDRSKRTSSTKRSSKKE